MTSQLKYYYNNRTSKKEIIILPNSELSFKTKTALKQYLIEVAKDCLDVLITPTHKYYRFFHDMIDRHYDIEFEEGMKFKITTEKGYDLKRSKERTPWRRTEPYRCYCILPSDQKWRSFSLFNKCVNGSNHSDQILKNKNYRKEIEPQISLYRKTNKWQCCLCESSKLIDVDHYPITFSELVKEYESLPDPKDPFASYHEKYAKLRLLCKPCHIRYGLR